MNKTSGTSKDAADKLVRGIKRKTRKDYSAEEKIRIVRAGLRDEESVAALCRRGGSPRAFIFPGQRNSSKLGRTAWRVTRRDKRHPLKSKN